MAAVLGDTPSSWENNGDSTDTLSETDTSMEKSRDLSLLMDKLHSRASQHKNWSESIKAVRMAIMNDKRQQSDALERVHIQSCLDKLHRAIKVVNQQSLLERLESIARQLGLSFSVPASSENRAFISSEMFRVEIIMETGGVIKDVKVCHHGDPTSCEELTEVLSKGQFEEFVVHLEGLQDIYKIPGDKKQKSKAFLALHSLESDLNNLAQLQSSIKGVANCIHKSPLGILLPRKGGCPMKLIYFVSPYDLLDKKTKSPHPMTVEAITEHELGQSVTVCIEPCSPNKLQNIPLMSVVKQEGKSLPRFQGLANVNSCTLSACFVLVLPQPIPVALSNVQSIQKVTELDVISVGETKPLLQLINQQAARTHNYRDGKEFFVTLPDQQHVYFMSDISGCSLDQPAVMVSRIPFTHPTSVAPVLNHLRQQVLFNTVIQSCIRPNAQQDIKSSVVFDLAAASLQSLTVTFEHPLQDTMVTADLDLCDKTNVKFKVCIGQDGDELCSDDTATKIFQRCLSIPVTLRSVIHKVSEKLRKEPSPEPVPATTRKPWPNFLPSRYNHPVPFSMDTKVQQPNPLHLLPQQVSMKAPISAGVTASVGMMPNPGMEPLPIVPQEEKPSSNPLLATLLDQDSPSPESSPVSESPMLSKLLGDDTPALASSIPAPPQQKVKKSGKRRSRDTLTGRSPKHRVSDSDSSSVSIDQLESSISFDDMPNQNTGGRTAMGLSVGIPHSHSRDGSSNMMIDLTSPDTFPMESPMKKLENTLDRIISKDQQQHPQHDLQSRQDKELSMMLSDGKDIDSRNFYPSSTVPKNEKVSTSLEELLIGSGEVSKTTDPNFYASSGDVRKGLTSPGLLRQNSNQNAQNQHSGESGEHTPVSVGSSRGSTSVSPNYSDCDTPREKSCDNHSYGLSAMLSGGSSNKTAASFSTTQTAYTNNISMQHTQRDFKVEKIENSSLRSLLDNKNRIENSIVNSDIQIKPERSSDLKLTLKRAPRVVESSPSHVNDVSLPKSKSTEMFDFESDDDEPFHLNRRNMTVSVIAPSPNRFHIKPKLSNVYDSSGGKLDKHKKNELRHSLSDTSKRKRKLDSKKEKKKRKTSDRGGEPMGEAAVYTTSAVETEVKSDNLKVKFIKSGSKVSMESSPKTSSPSSSKDRDKGESSRKFSKDHSDKYEVSTVKSKSSSSSGQRLSSSSHKHRSISASSVTVSKADSKLITKTPTIKLKPITIPHSSSVNVPPVKTPPTNSTASSKGSLTPTSTTIGRIGAVSLATSGTSKSGSMTPPPSGKSSTSTSVKTPPIGKGPMAASVYSSKSQTSSTTSGKSSSGSSARNMAPTSRNSTGSMSKGSNGLPSSSNKIYSSERKSGSPSISGGRNTPNSSAKSSSSLTKLSTSSSKPQSGSSTNAANVLSFLNTNASGIASLPPIPKRSSSSGNPSKSTSTPLSTSNPSSSTASSTSSYSSTSVNTTAAVKSVSAINTSLLVSKSNSTSGYNTNISNNKSPGASSFSSKGSNSTSKSNSTSLPNQHKSVGSNSATSGGNSNRSFSVSNSGVSNRTSSSSGASDIAGNKSSTSYTKLNSGNSTGNSSSSVNSHSVNSKTFSTSTITTTTTHSSSNKSAAHTPPVNNSESSRKSQLVSPTTTAASVNTNSTTNSNSASSSSASSSSTVVTPVSSSSGGSDIGNSGGNNTTCTTSPGGSCPSTGGSSGCNISANAALAKQRARKSSLSAVIDKLTKSSQQSVHVSSVPEGAKASDREGGEGSPGEDRGPDDPFEADMETDDSGLASGKKIGNLVSEEGKGSNAGAGNKSGTTGRGRSESTENSQNKLGTIANVQKSPGSKGCSDSPSKKFGSGENISGKTTTSRDDSRNLFTSLMDSLSYEDQTSKGESSNRESDKNTSNSKNMVSQVSGMRSTPEREGINVSRDVDHPSPAKKARTHSPKTNPNKFNGESASPREGQVDSKKLDSDKECFKVPTPKSLIMEEKDSEDTENLVVRRKSRTSTTKPVLSPASPASSPENLIIDCQTVSPRTLQNKTNSPQCNQDIILADGVIENSKKINSALKTPKSHAPSPKVKGSPGNSPVTVVTKDHSNPSSVSNHSPCDIDDDLMNEAIMGFNS